MNKMMIGLVSATVLAFTLQGYDKQDRRMDMQVMESSMAQIQKGILYNNKKIVYQGILNLKESASNIEIIAKTQMDYGSKYAKKQAKEIIKLADAIERKMKNGQKHSAATSYTSVLNKCISCHNKLRKWNNK